MMHNSDKLDGISTESGDDLSVRQHALILLFFTAVTLLFTWPLAQNLNGTPGGDAYVFAHSFWWFKKALSSFANPFYTNYIFYPDGVNLAFQSATFGNFLLTLPVTFLAGPTVGVNIALMMTFVLAAWFTFLLAYRLTGDLLASLVAAYIYAFSPFHALHGVGHLNISSIHCLPAVLYALLRTFTGKTWRWPIVTGIFGGITLMTDQLHTILVAAAGTMVAVWCVMNHRRLAMELRDICGRFMVMLAVALVVASPYVAAVVHFMSQSSNALKRSVFERGGANMFSGDLLAYLLPTPWHPLFGKLVPEGHSSLENPQQYIGWSVLVLALAAVLLCWRSRPLVRILGVVAGCTFILSLGTTLHIGGQWQWADGKIIKLPYYYLAQAPLFSDIRTPGRFQAATGFALALLAAYGLMQLRRKYWQPRRELYCRLGVAVVLTLLVMEYLPPSRSFANIPHSPVLQAISRNSGIRTVLWLPLSRHSSFAKNGHESPGRAMYYQTMHGKPILNGLMTRVNDEQLAFNDELLDRLVAVGTSDRVFYDGKAPAYTVDQRTAICQDAVRHRPAWNELRQKLGLDAVVVQNPFNKQGWATRQYIECLTGFELVYETDSELSYLLFK